MQVCAIAWLSLFPTLCYSAGVAPAVQVSAAWIRWLPGDLPAAGYATLSNVGDQAVTLTGVSTPDYGASMFHESRIQRGVDQMMPVPSIVIRPHFSVSFAPGGYHIMFMEPKRAIQPGDRVLVILHFAAGQSLQVSFEVRKPDGSAAERATQSKGG
ncbi:MAG: copper chaperone PCu(A)C [Steroidobacteraceae bacterium]